jgi:hypothetical protein
LSFAIANFLAAAVGFALTGQLAKLTTVPYAAIGAVVIPVSFLSAFEARDGWMGVLVLLALTPLGLGMKAFKWPRSPLVLGFILGPVIELNLQSALSAYTPLEILQRPITDVLLVLIALTTWFMLRLSRQIKPGTAPAETAAAVLDMSRPKAPARWTWRHALGGGWRLEHSFALLVLMGAAAAIWIARSYPPQARFLPLLTAGGVIALTLAHLLFERQRETGEIMDIGLRSRGEPDVGRAVAKVAAFIALLLLLAATVGLQYGCLAVALLFPIVMMEGRARWITSLVGGSLVALIALWLLDFYMGVYWPDPVLADWVRAALR